MHPGDWLSTLAGDWRRCILCRDWAEEALELRTQGTAEGRPEYHIEKSVIKWESAYGVDSPPRYTTITNTLHTKLNHFYLEEVTHLRGNTDRKEVASFQHAPPMYTELSTSLSISHLHIWISSHDQNKQTNKWKTQETRKALKFRDEHTKKIGNLKIRRQWNNTFNIQRKIVFNLDFLTQINHPSSLRVGDFRYAKCLSPLHTFSGRYCRMWVLKMIKSRKRKCGIQEIEDST